MGLYVMVTNYGGDPFLPQWDPIGPKMGPRGPHRDLANHRRVDILVKSVDPGVVKNGPFGDGDQLWWGPIFWPQSIVPKMGPRGSPP